MIQTLRPGQLGRASMAAIVFSSVGFGCFSSTFTPVQAATLNQVDIGGIARIENAEGSVGSLATLNFSEFPTPKYTTAIGTAFLFPEGVFAAGNPTQATIQDITNLLKTTTNPTPSVGQERDRWERNYGLTPLLWLDTPQWDFNLTRFVLHRVAHVDTTNPAQDNFTGDIFGYFTMADGTQLDLTATGNELTGPARLVLEISPNGASYTGTLRTDAVPTPALLPGAIALGTSLWRKRKQRECEAV